MDIHNIHGTNVGFHNEAKEAKDFLADGVKSHVAQGYLRMAKEKGEFHFSNENGQNFKIIHEQGENGKDVFSVVKGHH